MPEPSESRPEPAPQRRRVRRAPKFPQFMITGGLIGLIFGLVAALQGDFGDYSKGATMGLFAVIFTGIGVLAGGAIAVYLDKRSLR